MAAPQSRPGASNGPVIIRGTPGVSLKMKSAMLQSPSTSIGLGGLGTATPRSTFGSRDFGGFLRPGAPKREFIDDFKAFEWEEFDREADRGWYDQDEGGDYVDDANPER